MELNKDNVQVKVVATTYQEAIDKVGKILVDQGKITEAYVEAMKQAVVDMGPYMVIMPGLALVHAEPSDAVKETSIALITLEKPVNFNSHNDPVYVLLCLASVDKTSHIESLSKIAKKLMEPNIIDELKKCKTVDEVLTIFNR